MSDQKTDDVVVAGVLADLALDFPALAALLRIIFDRLAALEQKQ